MILLSTIIEEFEELFFDKYENIILPSHRKALWAMKICRTKFSPQMLASCSNDDCSNRMCLPHSCGHRSCPHCQNYESWRWIENQLTKQLPVQYNFITFTLPKQLRQIAWENQKLVYTLFFLCVKEVLSTFTKNDKKLQGIAGFTMVMHTNSRTLGYHPHIHVIMPRACINRDTKSWCEKKSKYLFNHRALAIVFRAMLLKKMIDNGLQIPRACPKKWIIFCKNVGGGDKALIYLGKYLYKGVIQEKDILKSENGMVTFRYLNSKTKKYLTRTVKGEYFLWLLMQHVLPKGFHRARDYGLLHHRSKELIKLLQYLLKGNPHKEINHTKERAKIICHQCGYKMKIILTMIPYTKFWQLRSYFTKTSLIRQGVI